MEILRHVPHVLFGGVVIGTFLLMQNGGLTNIDNSIFVAKPISAVRSVSKQNQNNVAKTVYLGTVEFPQDEINDKKDETEYVGFRVSFSSGCNSDDSEGNLESICREHPSANTFTDKNNRGVEYVPSGFPVEGYVTSEFGMRELPFEHKARLHKGIDIVNEKRTPVHATAKGTVSDVGSNRIEGNYVVITHGNGYQTLYAHNSSVLVREGQSVNKGEVISLMGNTGRTYSADKGDGTHLHYGVYRNGEALNPRDFQ